MNDYSYHITLDVMMNNSFAIQNVFLTMNDYFDGFTSTSELPGTVPAKRSGLHDQNIGGLFRCGDHHVTNSFIVCLLSHETSTARQFSQEFIF